MRCRCIASLLTLLLRLGCLLRHVHPGIVVYPFAPYTWNTTLKLKRAWQVCTATANPRFLFGEHLSREKRETEIIWCAALLAAINPSLASSYSFFIFFFSTPIPSTSFNPLHFPKKSITQPEKYHSFS